ncbi:MAG: nucleotidyltransferase domain-containing protein [Eubacterium sp.]|nr:nucleotidyltransferase domain-containing protein [Eubacterium sp.]
MPDIVNKSINQFLQQMKRIFGSHLSEVIVYGSYARDDYQDNSDVDIMVLVNLSEAEIKKFENEVYDIAFEIEMGMGVDISPIIKNKAQYEYWVDVLPFYQNVGKEGLSIFRQPQTI